jgi:hypothetical protein
MKIPPKAKISSTEALPPGLLGCSVSGCNSCTPEEDIKLLMKNSVQIRTIVENNMRAKPEMRKTVFF